MPIEERPQNWTSLNMNRKRRVSETRRLLTRDWRWIILMFREIESNFSISKQMVGSRHLVDINYLFCGTSRASAKGCITSMNSIMKSSFLNRKKFSGTQKRASDLLRDFRFIIVTRNKLNSSKVLRHINLMVLLSTNFCSLLYLQFAIIFLQFNRFTITHLFFYFTVSSIWNKIRWVFHSRV